MKQVQRLRSSSATAAGSCIPMFLKALNTKFRSIDDALKTIRNLSDRVKELLRLHKETERLVASGLSATTSAIRAAFTITLDLGDTKTSKPAVTPTSLSIGGKDLANLKKNYGVVKELWETRRVLDKMIQDLQVEFAKKGVSPDKAVAEVKALMRTVDNGLDQAFQFINGLANSSMPTSLTQYARAVNKAISKSITYSDSATYVYVFENEGALVYSYYLHLKDVYDDDGDHYADYYIMVSEQVGGPDAGTYVAVSEDFAPPSERTLVRKVPNIKAALRSLSMLLSLDQFSSSLDSIPIDQLLKDKVNKDAFLYQNHIKSISIDEDQLVFDLKPDAASPRVFDMVSFQLMKELQDITKNRGVRLRMRPSNVGKTPKVTFFFVNTRSNPILVPQDLDFLKMRFGLDENTLNRVVKTINEGNA